MNGFWICAIISLIIYSALYDWAYIGLYFSMLLGYFVLSFLFVPSSASKFNSIRRKIAIGTWSDPDSPECHGHFKIRIGSALEFIDKFNTATGKKITITHLSLKVVADALKDFKDFTGRLAFGYYVPYETIDISCLVALEGGKDLDFVCVNAADTKTLLEICSETEKKITSVRSGDDYKAHKKAKNPFKLLPSSIAGIIMEIISYITTPLGLGLPMLGVEKNPCGCLCITNVGSQGVEIGYAPFPTIVRVPTLVALSSIKEEAIIVDGKIVVDKILTVLATFDHRFADGTRATKLLKEVKTRMEAPHLYLKIE